MSSQHDDSMVEERIKREARSATLGALEDILMAIAPDDECKNGIRLIRAFRCLRERARYIMDHYGLPADASPQDMTRATAAMESATQILNAFINETK